MEDFPACCGIAYNSKGCFSDNYYEPGDEPDDCEYEFPSNSEQVGLTLTYTKEHGPEGWVNVPNTQLWYKVNPNYQENHREYPPYKLPQETESMVPIKTEHPGLYTSHIYTGSILVISNFLYKIKDYLFDYSKRNYTTEGRKLFEYETADKLTREVKQASAKLILIDLAEQQILANEAMVLEAGFKLVTEFVNPKHTSVNRLYYLVKE